MCSIKCVVTRVQCAVCSAVQCLSNDVIAGSRRWDHQGGNYGDSGGEERTGGQEIGENSLLQVDTGEE